MRKIILCLFLNIAFQIVYGQVNYEYDTAIGASKNLHIENKKISHDTATVLTNDISNLSIDQKVIFRIQVTADDATFDQPQPNNFSFNSLENQLNNFVTVENKTKCIPEAKYLTVKFFVWKKLSSKNLKYFILENDKDTIVNWVDLNGKLTDQDNVFNIFEIKHLYAENRFFKFGVYDVTNPGNVLYQTTSTIELSSPRIQVVFELPDGKINRFGFPSYSFRTITDTAFYYNIRQKLIYIKTDNAPELFNLFIEYGDKEHNSFTPKWFKLEQPLTWEDALLYGSGYNYKAEIPGNLIRSDDMAHMLFLYSNDLYPYPKKNLKNKSNEVKFKVRYKLGWKDFLVVGLIFGVPTMLAALLFFTWYKNKQKRKLQTQKFATTEAKLKLQSLRSQLNPHFIFNALSGIQNLMNKNETEKANSYLNTFSRLTRNVLDDSANETITLNNEVKLLDDYLKMEQLRFGFQYKINVDDDLDKHNIEIPSMLLQPFAENAVKHGIAALKENGLIEIDFTKSGNSLILSVADNGEGFDADGSYTGMGLQLSKNRISLLNTVHKNTPLNLQINSSGKGTTVIITLQNWLS